MREAEWVEKLWQQVFQLSERVATKEDVKRLEEKTEGMANKEAVERMAGKIDTLLINAATKVEVGRIEKQIGNAPTKDDVQRLEVRLTDFLPQMVTKQEWSTVESRLAKTLTKDDFIHIASALREGLDSTSQAISELLRQVNSLRNLGIFLLLLDGLILALIVFLLLKLG